MIDLDLFKLHNDRLGHNEGDRLLQDAVAAWRDELRESDLLWAKLAGGDRVATAPDKFLRL